jgi:HD superfamily phosphodiesterase
LLVGPDAQRLLALNQELVRAGALLHDLAKGQAGARQPSAQPF